MAGQIYDITAAVIRHCGCNYYRDKDKFLQFLTRNHLDSSVGFLAPNTSTCGLTVLAAWYEAGVQHPLLRTRYAPGTAIARVAQIARDLGAVRQASETPVEGAVLHYYSHRPSYDDHVEVVLNSPMNWMAITGGGGRPNCEISRTTAPVDLRFSRGRPLQCWYDPVALLVGTEGATQGY